MIVLGSSVTSTAMISPTCNVQVVGRAVVVRVVVVVVVYVGDGIKSISG